MKEGVKNRIRISESDLYISRELHCMHMRIVFTVQLTDFKQDTSSQQDVLLDNTGP